MSLDFNAFWLYRTSGGDGRETRSEFQERYSLGVGPQLDWRPTHALSVRLSLGYNRTQRNSGSGTVRGEEITPAASINLNNDIFTLGLAGSASRFTSGSGAETVSHSWDTTLASAWDIPFWPNFRINYGQRDDEAGSGDFFRRSESIQTSKSLNVDWDLLLAKLDYRYSTTEDENRETGAVGESTTHFGRVETAGRFLNNRISYNLSQQVQDTRSVRSGESGVDGTFTFELEGILRVAAYGPTDPRDPLGLDYEDPQSLVPLSVSRLDEVHIAFANAATFSSAVRLMRLYLDPVEGVTAAEAAALTWTLYERNFGDSWQQVPGIFLGGYNAALNTVDIAINRSADEVLLVALNDLDTSLVLIDAAALELRTADEGEEIRSRSRSYMTTASLRFSLTRTLSASTNLSLEQIEGDARTTNRRTMSGRLRWTPAPWVTPSVGYSESRENRDDDPELINRSYSLTVATIPLTTMSVGFGATLTERYSGEQKTDETMKYSVTTSAQIYPDLNTALSLTWQERKAFTSSLDEDGIEVTQRSDTANFNSRFNLNARLQHNLVADLTANYRTSEREVGSSENADATLNLQYRPSNMLVIRGFYTAFFLDSTQKNIFGSGLSLALLRTDRARLTFNYNMTRSDEMTNSFGMTGSWDISRSLGLQARTNYTMAQTNFYSAQVSLNLRL